MDTVPKDGTEVEFWNFHHNIIVKGMRWGSSAERDPANYGPGQRWHHLGQTGWYNDNTRDGGTIYVDTQFSHWRIPPKDNGPTVEQMNRFFMIAKLKRTPS